MKFQVNYTVVGLFVVGLGLALIVGIYWLSGKRDQKDYHTYWVLMKGTVSGLSEEAPVKFNGVQVGYVSNISLDKQNLRNVKLTLKINKEVPISKSTVARLMTQGVTGISYLGLEAKTSNAPLLKAKPNQPYPIIPSEPSLFVEIGDALLDVTTNLNRLTKNLQGTFNATNQLLIQKSLSNIAKFTDVLDKNSKKIDSTIQSINVLSKNAAQASHQFTATLNDIQKASTTFQSASYQASLVLEQFSQRTLPNFDGLVDQLSETSVNLQQLSSEAAAQPSVFIRGKNPPPLGPGEH